MALLPVFPPLAILSLGSLFRFRQLPRPWPVLLAVFVGTQLLAAVLTANPGLSVLLALLRSVYVVALVLAGFQFGGTAAFRPLLIGYGVVAATAFITTVSLHPAEVFQVRLSHPYYTPVSTGLAGVLGLLVAITWRSGPRTWRLIGGALALGMFLWSGSRGPLIALAAGLVAVLAVSLRTQWRSVLLTLAGAAALVLVLQSVLPTDVTTRFADGTLGGRGGYWTDATQTARAHPWGGIGPYQLGPLLSTQYSPGNCTLWLQDQDYGLNACPSLINRIADRLRGAWLIAHNTGFHLLGETGVIGFTGWLALMGALAVAAWRSRDPLVNAVTWGTAAIGLVDNPTLLPSLGTAELYWLLSGAGIALSLRQQPGEQKSLSPAGPLLATVLLAYFTLPLWLERVRPARVLDLPVVSALTLPLQVTAGERVNLFLNVKRTSEPFRLHGLACPVSRKGLCLTVFDTQLRQDGWNQIAMTPLGAGRYLLKVQLFDEHPRLALEHPLSEFTQMVDVQ